MHIAPNRPRIHQTKCASVWTPLGTPNLSSGSRIYFRRPCDLLLILLPLFRGVLMRHLDEEVKDLGAENMKKYWTLEEVDRMVM